MAGRQIDIRQISGFRDMIYKTVLTEQHDRDVMPGEDLLARIRAAGTYFVAMASEKLEGDPVAYVKIEWPEAGPLQRGMIFALNPRHPNDPETGTAGFYRLYSGTGHRDDAILTWEQAENDFHAYATASFGRPTAVE